MNTRTLARAPYRAARIPFTLLQKRVISRMPSDSAPRLVFERAVGSLDRLAGRLLGDERLALSGLRQQTRADDLMEATRLENEAAVRKYSAARTRQQANDEADKLRKQADDRQREDVQQTAAELRAAKRATHARVRAQADTVKQAADDRAARAQAAARQDRQAADRKASAQEQRANAKASTAITAAAEEKKQAVTRRAEATKLSELANAKNNARKSGTTSS